MIDKIRKDFISYYKTFDFRKERILYKFHHSFRVMEYSKEIAESLNLNNSDIELSTVIGLLHDIARFKQWTIYETFVDRDSFDHGDEGVNILKELDILDYDDETKNIIYTAIKNHNKYEIKVSNEREELFSKIIRDADKIDIMKEVRRDFEKLDYSINEKVVEDFLNNKLVDSTYVNNPMEANVRTMSFIYDINYKYSIEFIKKHNIIDNSLNLLKLYCNNEELVEKLEKHIYKYIEER